MPFGRQLLLDRHPHALDKLWMHGEGVQLRPRIPIHQPESRLPAVHPFKILARRCLNDTFPGLTEQRLGLIIRDARESPLAAFDFPPDERH